MSNSNDSLDQRTLIDALALSIIVLDQELRPVFISSGAASLLRIPHRDRPGEYTSILEPLIELTRPLSDNARRASLIFRPDGQRWMRLEEVLMHTADGRFVSVLAQSVKLESPAVGFAINIDPMQSLEPILSSFQRIRRTRSLSVLAACTRGGRLSLEDALVEGNDPYLSESSEPQKNFSELLPVLSTAVDIVDQLIPTSIKITLRAATPALLKTPEMNLLRVLCHTLLEVADFASPVGRISIFSTISTAPFAGARATGIVQDKVVLSMRAERERELLLSGNALECYLHRVLYPTQYNVTLAEKGEAYRKLKVDTPKIAPAEEGEEQPSQNKRTGLEHERTLDWDRLSENLKIASSVATESQISLFIERIDKSTVVLEVEVPLSDVEARP